MNISKPFFLLTSLIIVFFSTGCKKNTTISGDKTLTIRPIQKAVLAGQTVKFELQEVAAKGTHVKWDFGDGTTAEAAAIEHVFNKPGIYHIIFYSDSGCGMERQSSMILRVHTPETVSLPQVVLDTDARNEADDQHYIAYSIYSGLDVLAINSIHNNAPGSSAINYGEIFYILQLMHRSGLPLDSLPYGRIYHGAKTKLIPPASGNWSDTQPVITEASKAILAAARGASLDNPVWIMPVGPCTNIASAVLQAHKEGFDLSKRIRVLWLGGIEKEYYHEYNGGNDPWSVYVMGQSGLEFTILLSHPTSLKLHIDKRVESHLYPDNELGNYLKTIIPVFLWGTTKPKAIHDVCVPAAIISDFKGLGWVKKSIPIKVNGPDEGYTWQHVEEPSNIHLIMDIDGEAMKADLFNTLNGHPTKL